jgi:hypothetical protein
MFLVKTQKVSRFIVGPLVLLWLLCQSMVLCAGVLNSSSSNEGSSDHITSKIGHSHSQTANASAHSHPITKNMPSSLPSDSMSGDMEMADCCDEQESAVYNSFYLSIVFLLLFPVIWLVIALSKTLVHSLYHREPPPRFNYPKTHVFNCVFLN